MTILADWDGLYDHLKDALWEDIFKLSASAALPVNFVSGLRLESMYIFLIVSVSPSFFHLHGFQLFMLLP